MFSLAIVLNRNDNKDTRMATDRGGNTLNKARRIDIQDKTVNLSDFIGKRDPNDYYKFSLLGRSKLSLSIKGMKDGNADLQLLNSSGKVLESSRSSGTQNESIKTNLGVGTYYIRVYRGSGDTNYELTASAPIIAVRPKPDPGSEIAEAYNVGDLSITKAFSDFVGTTDTTDIYRITLKETKRVSLALTELQGVANLYITYDVNNNGIFDSGETIARDESLTTRDRILNTDLGAGTYFVWVQAGSNANTKYKLTTSSVKADQLTNDPGLDYDSALAIGTLGGQTKTFRDFVGVADSNDFYQFNLDTTKRVNLNLTDLNQSANLYIAYDANSNGIYDSGELIARDESLTNRNRTLSVDLGAGTYFVWVDSSSNVYNTTYKLTAAANLVPSLATDPGQDYDSALEIGTLNNTPQVFKDFVGSVDSNDFYKFNLNTTKTVALTLTELSQAANLYLAFDSNGNGLFDSGEILRRDESLTTRNRTITTDLGEGTYFIWVDSPGVDDNTTYTLRALTTS